MAFQDKRDFGVFLRLPVVLSLGVGEQGGGWDVCVCVFEVGVGGPGTGWVWG